MKRLQRGMLLSVGLALVVSAVVGAAGQRQWSRLGRLQGDAGPQPYVAAIATHPTDPDILYVGSIMTDGPGALLYRSDDGGATWQPAAAGLPTDLPLNTGVEALALHPDEPQVVYVALHRRGVWRSGDGGVTWQSVSGGSLAAGEDVSALLAMPGSPGIVYALSNEGLNVLDGSKPWRAANRGLPAAGAVVYNGLAIDPTNPRRAYIATSPLGVYRTTNSGQRWTKANGDLPGGVRNVKGVTVAPDGAVFITLRGAGLFRSNDGGDTWTPTQTGITFTTTLYGTVSAPVFDPAAPDVAYAFNADGVWRSDDGGVTWREGGDGLSVTAVVSTIAFQPARPNTPLVGTAASGVWRLTEVEDPPPPPVAKMLYVPVVRR